MKNFVSGMLLLAAGLAVAPALRAEETSEPAKKRDFEIGTSLAGISVMSGGGDSVTIFGAPNSGFFLTPTIYGTCFVGRHIAIEPQAGLLYISGDDDSFHSLVLAGQVDYFFNHMSQKSAYLLGRAWLQNAGGDEDSETNTWIGAGVGYRIPIGDRAAVRLEGRFDHRLGDDDGFSSTNIFGIGVGIGILP